jgi:hypothetical protein
MPTLVLGLLIGAAKSSFETQNTQVKQIMRRAVGPFADRLWREKQACAGGCEMPRPLALVPERITIGSNRDAL